MLDPAPVRDLHGEDGQGRFYPRRLAQELDREDYAFAVGRGRGVELGDHVVQGAGLVIGDVAHHKIRLEERSRRHLDAGLIGVGVHNLHHSRVESGLQVNAVDVLCVHEQDLQRLDLPFADFQHSRFGANEGFSLLGKGCLGRQ
ncbi:MAG: hypothetical protein COY47_01170 [Chloroflexi bacterium CG_4_10_14_0_8_um_filter_57_5]|nr:MAG: hypothetical protein COW33_05330 [Anaerolineae bacterium CG17_big_fil_post_rev_8_21_14_2_50_57_27]PIX47492.1 MAG: hypothetical protein COZ54_01190 [Anaerolineae bacterium CG_4_8_14_3_um_filter_59_70]PIZ26318.1 MAG: hypothetical protein COY47_01170 [Chloroflexi bacterium CG_4_10_14_0_8_um_filter_57_5]PJH76334.1 MAG: hypothetical protein CO064_01860 [Anaerolineae bacterium CG_4_9_14_0_8_um_filter_58_9]